jgi:hypothetical protein
MDYKKAKGRDEPGIFFSQTLLNERATDVCVVVGQQPGSGGRGI